MTPFTDPAAVASFAALRAAEPKPPAGFRALFNGQDLTGWHGLNPQGRPKGTCGFDPAR